MKKAKRWIRRHRQQIWLLLGGAVVATVLLVSHLTDLVSGVSRPELALSQVSRSLGGIAHQPQYWPLTAGQWLFGLLPGHQLLWLRLPSVLLALLTIAAVVYILRRWYGPRTASFGFVIFVCAAWQLHAGRSAGPDIMYLWALPALLCGHLILYDYAEEKWSLYVWLGIQLVVLPVPGLVWFVLLNAWWQREDIKLAFATLKRLAGRLGLAILALVLLAPLVVGLAVGDTAHLALTLLGLPLSMPSLHAVASRAGQGLLFIAVRGSAPDASWLNHLPILDAFMACSLLVGIYFYARHLGATRSRLIAIYALLGFILYSLTGPVTLSIIVPLLYLVAAAGIAYLLHLWLGVFPRNPLARGLGIGVLALAIALSSLYSLRQYFLAWPHHPATQSAFSQHKIPRSHL